MWDYFGEYGTWWFVDCVELYSLIGQKGVIFCPFLCIFVNFHQFWPKFSPNFGNNSLPLQFDPPISLPHHSPHHTHHVSLAGNTPKHPQHIQIEHNLTHHVHPFSLDANLVQCGHHFTLFVPNLLHFSVHFDPQLIPHLCPIIAPFCPILEQSNTAQQGFESSWECRFCVFFAPALSPFNQFRAPIFVHFAPFLVCYAGTIHKFIALHKADWRVNGEIEKSVSKYFQSISAHCIINYSLMFCHNRCLTIY